jgi:hypothetical protein
VEDKIMQLLQTQSTFKDEWYLSGNHVLRVGDNGANLAGATAHWLDKQYRSNPAANVRIMAFSPVYHELLELYGGVEVTTINPDRVIPNNRMVIFSLDHLTGSERAKEVENCFQALLTDSFTAKKTVLVIEDISMLQESSPADWQSFYKQARSYHIQIVVNAPSYAALKAHPAGHLIQANSLTTEFMRLTPSEAKEVVWNYLLKPEEANILENLTPEQSLFICRLPKRIEQHYFDYTTA